MIQLTLNNLKIMTRNRHSTFWALFFPLLLVVVFGLFQVGNFGGATVTVLDNSTNDESKELIEQISSNNFFEVEQVESIETAMNRLNNGETEYVLTIPPDFNYSSYGELSLQYTDQDPQQNEITLLMLSNFLNPDKTSISNNNIITTIEIKKPEATYFDTVLLGLVGLGIMTNSIISIAVKISNYRNQSILKRMLVTPLPIWKFFASEITAHLILAIIQAIIILGVGIFLFGASIRGNPAGLLFIILMGSVVFLNIGFIMSAWTNSPSAASGMGNAIALPMIFFSGTFFSVTNLPWIMPTISELLPLTPMLSALRDIGINGYPIWSVWQDIAALAAWIVVTSVIAIKVFRFN